jgi:hypothetical protein
MAPPKKTYGTSVNYNRVFSKTWSPSHLMLFFERNTHLTFEKRKATILDIQLHTYRGKYSKANPIKNSAREGRTAAMVFLFKNSTRACPSSKTQTL